MKRHFVYLLLSAILFLQGYACATSENSNEEEVDITDSINKFSFEMYSRIKDLPQVQDSEGNLFFSPYSISTALAMTYSGARGNTAIEMAKVLQLPESELEKIAAGYAKLQSSLQADPNTSGYQLNVANALWGQEGYGFLPEFLDLNSKYFGSGLTELNFAQSEEARQIINTWVEQQTKEKIKDLIPSGAINAMTRLVLTNAIYFKGNWAIQFKEENTQAADFHVNDEKTVQAQMMYQKEDFVYGENEEIQILEMPYKGEELSMMIILPKENISIESFEQQLAENPSELIESVNKSKREVEVYLPKFKMTCGTLKINNILMEMGMIDAFTDAADFSGMTGGRELFISDVMHKAFVEVNEEGTEAAAATAVGIRLLSIPAPPPVFRADRPFIFVIKENNSDCILFMGRVMNPTLES